MEIEVEVWQAMAQHHRPHLPLQMSYREFRA
jgi:hypothetical protein